MKSSENPWHNITVENYVNHMLHPNVAQLQMLNRIIKQQIGLIPPDKRGESIVAILGITEGNGLEHIETHGISKVIGIDINKNFLNFCQKKYGYLKNALVLQQIDLVTQKDIAVDVLGESDLIITNLVIEHIHLEHFIAIIKELPRHGQRVSCVIQINPDGAIASKSGFEHTFSDVVTLVEEVDEFDLILQMKSIHFFLEEKFTYTLPNGKIFLRLDFKAPG